MRHTVHSRYTARFLERVEELLDEERIAGRALDDILLQSRIELGSAQHLASQRHGLALPEGPQV